MDIPDYFVLACVASVLVGLSKGGLPTVGMLGVPLLSLMIPPLTATTLLLPVFVISDWVGIYLYRKQFSWINLKRLVPAGVLGVALGWGLAAFISDQILSLLIGVVGVAFCLNMWIRPPAATGQAPGVWSGYFWGALSGFTSFISHSGGPPFQIYVLPQRLPKLVFAGTSTIFFAIINASKIWPYQALRPYSLDTLVLAGALIPFAIAGTVAGAYLTQRIHEKWFYWFIQVSLFAVSIKLVVMGLG